MSANLKCEITVWVTVYTTASGPGISVSTYQPTFGPGEGSAHFGPYTVEFMPQDVADLLNSLVVSGEVKRPPKIVGKVGT